MPLYKYNHNKPPPHSKENESNRLKRETIYKSETTKNKKQKMKTLPLVPWIQVVRCELHKTNLSLTNHPAMIPFSRTLSIIKRVLNLLIRMYQDLNQDSLLFFLFFSKYDVIIITSNLQFRLKIEC